MQHVNSAFASKIAKTAPGEIVYLPVGVHDITPSVNGKAQRITVKVPADRGEEIAGRLQAALDKRYASDVRPRLAFDHAATGPASGHPNENAAFRFDPERGVILALNWSRAGRDAIEGQDYSYFSPSFLIDDDGTPAGLPEIGEIGSLVDEPAFRAIGKIAAAAATPEDHHTPESMKLLLAALAINPAAENAEGAAVTAITAMQAKIDGIPAIETARDDFKTKLEAANGKLTAAEGKIKEFAEKRADDLVKAAQLDGRILPKDEKTAAFYKGLITANHDGAEEALAGLPKINPDLKKPATGDAKDKTGDDEPKGLEAVSAAFAKELGEG